ncbi:MAG: YkgJ family cysteine cluster protein, partial [Promethearchaeota archaeon]
TEKGLTFIGLMKNEQGICCFYDQNKKKCLIYDLRPKFCRSFPFTFVTVANNSNIRKEGIRILYTEKAKNYCPGIGNDAAFIDTDSLIKLAQNIFKDLKENHIFNEEWNRNVKHITPSAKNFLLKIFGMRNE